MAFNLLLILFLVLVSFSLTPGYSLSTRDAVSKQDDESYVMASSDHGSSMIIIEDLVKARSLHEALHAGSKVVVSKKGSKSSSSKSKKGSKKKHKSKIGGLVGIIVAVIVVTIVIICLIIILKLYSKYKGKKAQRIEQGNATEEINGSSKTKTPKTEDHV